MAKDDIPLFFSTISIVVTLFLFFRRLYTERVSVAVEIKRCFIPPVGGPVLALDLSFVNRSRLNATIQSVSVEIRDEFIHQVCCDGNFSVFTKINGKPNLFTTEIPSTIQSLSSSRGWYIFKFDNFDVGSLEENQVVTIIIVVNGKLRESRLTLPKSTEVSML